MKKNYYYLLFLVSNIIILGGGYLILEQNEFNTIRIVKIIITIVLFSAIQYFLNKATTTSFETDLGYKWLPEFLIYGAFIHNFTFDFVDSSYISVFLAGIITLVSYFLDMRYLAFIINDKINKQSENESLEWTTPYTLSKTAAYKVYFKNNTNMQVNDITIILCNGRNTYTSLIKNLSANEQKFVSLQQYIIMASLIHHFNSKRAYSISFSWKGQEFLLKEFKKPDARSLLVEINEVSDNKIEWHLNQNHTLDK